MDSDAGGTGKAGEKPAGTEMKKSAAAQAHSDWAAAYDYLRPTGEVDSRAQQVLVTSLALIALCLAKQKPESIDILGFAFRTDEWLILAIPLAIIVLYAVVQLCIVWVIEKWKRAHAMFQPVSSLRLGWHSMLERKQHNAEELAATTVEMNRRRAEIWERYRARHEEWSRRNPMRVDPDGFDENAMLQWHEEENILQQQRDEQLERAGVAAFDAEVNRYWDDVMGGQQDEGTIVAEQALRGMKRLKWLRTARMVLDICIPLAIASTAFVVLILTIFFPSALSSAHIGSSLTRGR